MNGTEGVCMRCLRHGGLQTIFALSVWAFMSFFSSVAHAAPRHIVCVESVWCRIAQDIGGESVTTQALITSQDLDPHHLHPTPSMARQLAQADAVLINGATYDDWALPLSENTMLRMVATDYAPSWKEGDDPHLFFDPDTVYHFGEHFAHWLISQEPDHKAAIEARLNTFQRHYDAITQHLASLNARFHGQAIAVTEPAGERLLHRAGLHVIDQSWAHAIMNDSGVSPRETAALEDAITKKTVRFLLVNPTVSSPQIDRLVSLAQTHSVPVLRLGETLPSGLSWAEWMNTILTPIDRALSQSTP